MVAKNMNDEADQVVDVLAIGAGPGGLVAAMVAQVNGLEPLVIEKTAFVGGTSTKSFGALWFADNPRQHAVGAQDSTESAREYLKAVTDASGSATPERQKAYLEAGPRMLSFLEKQGLEFFIDHYPDYYPEATGGALDGRMLNSPLFDARRLGQAQGLVDPPAPLPMGLVVESLADMKKMALAGTSAKMARAAVGVVARSYWLKARGVKPRTLGSAYVCQLLFAARKLDVPIELQTEMTDLVVEDGRVVGAIVRSGATTRRIRARHGVLLDTGGFARDIGLREKFGPHPASTDWTLTAAGDTGDGYRATAALNAATDNLDEAYWLPLLVGADGKPQMFLAERHLPHSIIVDSSGSRFGNEASNYMEFGRAMYERQRTVPAVPAWLIVDSRHRRSYSLGTALPMTEPRKWLRSGHLKKAGSLRELAIKCGIDPAGLEAQVESFNEAARLGEDPQFHRGQSAYDRVYGDARMRPNPCLGTLEKGPFYAAQVIPGDLGMAGGVRTDEVGAVLSEDGTAIPGLYACGTVAASAMGRVYAGGGISLGQTSVFGFLAAEHMTSRLGTAHTA